MSKQQPDKMKPAINTDHLVRLKEPFASNFQYVNWTKLSMNSHDGAVDILLDNPDYIDWPVFCINNTNDRAVEFMIQNITKLNLYTLAKNRSDKAVLFITRLIDEINWNDIMNCPILNTSHPYVRDYGEDNNKLLRTDCSESEMHMLNYIYNIVYGIVITLINNPNLIAINWLKHNLVKYCVFKHRDTYAKPYYLPISPLIQWHYSVHNHTDEAVAMLDYNRNISDKEYICALCIKQNEYAMELLQSSINLKTLSLDNISTLCSNPTNGAIRIIKQFLAYSPNNIRKIPFIPLSANPCDAAVEFIREHSAHIVAFHISLNPNDGAIDLILQYPHLIDVHGLIHNPNPRVYDLIVERIDFTDPSHSAIWRNQLIFEEPMVFK